mmetsp:Transcript_57998/g.123217  ORF Transcript_57998/g.123217 Transcript_57998/m.123217 type:complete len:309 (-) Transcript_57998:14-940(-)
MSKQSKPTKTSEKKCLRCRRSVTGDPYEAQVLCRSIYDPKESGCQHGPFCGPCVDKKELLTLAQCECRGLINGWTPARRPATKEKASAATVSGASTRDCTTSSSSSASPSAALAAAPANKDKNPHLAGPINSARNVATSPLMSPLMSPSRSSGTSSTRPLLSESLPLREGDPSSPPLPPGQVPDPEEGGQVINRALAAVNALLTTGSAAPRQNANDNNNTSDGTAASRPSGLSSAGVGPALTGCTPVCGTLVSDSDDKPSIEEEEISCASSTAPQHSLRESLKLRGGVQRPKNSNDRSRVVPLCSLFS